MGVKPITGKTERDILAALNVSSLGLTGNVERVVTGQGDRDVGSELKRGLLSTLTHGTSELQTGAGEYHDETVADAIFPKTVNNAMLDRREQARRAADATKTQAEAKATATYGLDEDQTDKTLKATRKQAARLLLSGQGRKNSFIGSL